MKEEADMEKAAMSVESMSNVNSNGLRRDLHLRHMVMIAISGTIGTGLFMTSGKTIATAGPLGACKSLAIALSIRRLLLSLSGFLNTSIFF